MRFRRKNQDAEEQQTLVVGTGDRDGTNNSVCTAKYSTISFLPMATLEQFRRFANLYFAAQSTLMMIAFYTDAFESSVLPWSVIAPLSIVIFLGLLKEFISDVARHANDAKTNNKSCYVLRRQDDEKDTRKQRPSVLEGAPVELSIIPSTSSDESVEMTSHRSEEHISVLFKKVKRGDIYAGDLVLVRKLEMVPADIVLLGSSGDQGAAYVETSSIDGETNLKLRQIPKHPKIIGAELEESGGKESVEKAIKRITRLTTIGHPDGLHVLSPRTSTLQTNPGLKMKVGLSKRGSMNIDDTLNRDEGTPIMALKTEKPNASVNTFSGKISFPAESRGQPDIDIPLDVDNLLLRGAILRNTDWAIGVACFTGKDTKLVRNSIRTPSKTSRIDHMTNLIVIFVLALLIVYSITYGIFARRLHLSDFDKLWYIGYNTDDDKVWPYLPDDIPAPEWQKSPPSITQYTLSHITLLYNIIPLSAFITLEMITLFMMFLINWDKNMYHRETDTRAVARSTITSDLGQVEYVFSDKTGTLTQNVMKFKRCSVDGMIFGEPVEKNAPDSTNHDDESFLVEDFKPLSELTSNGIIQNVVKLNSSSKGSETGSETTFRTNNMSFNAEMFLRTMSICHTVFVEKNDYDSGKGKKKLASKLSRLSPRSKSSEDMDCLTSSTAGSSILTSSLTEPGNLMSGDGSPPGFTYQAESPDEGALVSAASTDYRFQLYKRDTDGITISSPSRSILADPDVYKGLKNNKLTPAQLASRTSGEDKIPTKANMDGCELKLSESCDSGMKSFERWTILAVNKFDSDRKRMSVVVQSPPELGSLKILFCKGADSAMLNRNVCEGAENLFIEESFDEDNDLRHSKTAMDSNVTTLLGMQSHLGVFASEGLRTLVLGMRVLSESTYSEWLPKFEKAASAIENREDLLKDAALEIETDIHIVGATAIEDKLQEGVPDTISKILQAGMKLWVLTGDKKETAIEIGYSTKVLTPTMQVTEISDKSVEELKRQVATEFLRLVKAGKISDASMSRNESYCARVLPAFLLGKRHSHHQLKKLNDYAQELAESYIERTGGTVNDEEKQTQSVVEKLSAADSFHSRSSVPHIFQRAQSAKSLILKRNSETSSTHEYLEPAQEPHNIFSVQSSESTERADNKKGTILEQLFSSDADARKGRLLKHQDEQRLENIDEEKATQVEDILKPSSSRALVIDGSSLAHFLGNKMEEELLFLVASHCESVIACRVTPKQKASVVKLVQRCSNPSPVTLAIGDGANDIGMIQAAHVGVGISGLEGQQAANSADFALAQFRFLQDLLLVHGRWNFIRLSKVLLYSFYKNGYFSGLLLIYGTRSMYSGTALFDVWIMASFNFVCAVPIMIYGVFDRDLEATYVKQNPTLYSSGPAGEDLSFRVKIRWFGVTIVYIVITYYLTAISNGLKGGMSSFSRNSTDYPGDGEGGDLLTFGTAMFTPVVVALAYKVLYESRSLIHGDLVSCRDKNKSREGFLSGIPYTWVGVIVFSILFYFCFVYGYQFVGRSGYSMLFQFVGAADHIYAMRPITWMLVILIPIACLTLDVGGKVFTNMFVPSQTQIHCEIQAQQELKRNQE